MFTHIHLTQEDSWHLVKKVITTHTNTFLTQQEQNGITSLRKKMVVISWLQ